MLSIIKPIENSIFVIDRSFERRSSMLDSFNGTFNHVGLFSNPSELILQWPRSGWLLAHDVDRSVDILLDYMEHSGRWLPIIAYAENPDIREVVKAMTKGTTGYINWPFTAVEVLEQCDAFAVKASHWAYAISRAFIARTKISCLTSRQQEILACVKEGLSNQSIGEQLLISPRTVEIHRAVIMRKIGANRLSQAIRTSIEADMLTLLIGQRNRLATGEISALP